MPTKEEREGDDMTDDELNARLERLSNDDLQQIAAGGSNVLTYHWRGVLIERMAREILDLRQQLAQTKQQLMAAKRLWITSEDDY